MSNRTGFAMTPLRSIAAVTLLVVNGLAGRVAGTDYFVTVGGGYRPSANQASLEANLQFFQRVLLQKHVRSRVHQIYFADGFDDAADLQVQRPLEPMSELHQLLAELHRQAEPRLVYRDHEVRDISGANSPDLIQRAIERVAQQAVAGDRVVIYVTAHGGRGTRDDRYNTTVHGWDDKSFSAREFTKWLDQIPTDVPVCLVMAQCYCGGFSHVIFEDFNDATSPSKQLRIGFFAQQHDLAAAGCRPDIENDEEFSSYFWGAILGESRTGMPITGCDLDSNGRVSFDEAYAYAMTASETIDIPLKASDELLRTYSRMVNEDDKSNENVQVESATGVADDAESTADDSRDVESGVAAAVAGETNTERDEPDGREAKSSSTAEQVHPAQSPAAQSVAVATRLPLHDLSGTLGAIIADAPLTTRHIVTALSRKLDFELGDDVERVSATLTELRQQTRGGRRRGGRGRFRNSGRRELLASIGEQWPDLADDKEWTRAIPDDTQKQQQWLEEIKSLPGYETYVNRRNERAAATAASQQAELRRVKIRRLLDTLECAVLAKNLQYVAEPAILQRYEQMLAFERFTLEAP